MTEKKHETSSEVKEDELQSDTSEGSLEQNMSSQDLGEQDLEVAEEEAIRQDMASLEEVAAQRDEYLEGMRHLQADFENYKKRISRQQAELTVRNLESFVLKLLPVLDTFDLAFAEIKEREQENKALEVVGNALFETLAKEGLEKMEVVGKVFDPQEQEAVVHEPGDGEHEVIEELRAGYRWKGHVIRPALVKVKG